ncbi:hypothetical protein KC19_2G276100 [Ceratodon purpureus]|uniref:Uncharacterized protein n=1 Tax=Ceratodon purpureus TaxID=3225 RepID=A0A8T0J1Y3_CERPU|nr:hypothetical protein KC19_2G276100 [Ceratodon purpureus]
MMTCSRIFYALSRLPRLKAHRRDHQVKRRRFTQPFWSYTSLQLPALPFQFHHGFRILTQLVPRISINSRFTLHHVACRFRVIYRYWTLIIACRLIIPRR